MLRMIKLTCLCVALLIGLQGTTVIADTWTGNVDDDITVAGNWTSGESPGAGTTCYFGVGDSKPARVKDGTNLTVNYVRVGHGSFTGTQKLYVDNNASLQANARILIGESSTGNGWLQVQQGGRLNGQLDMILGYTKNGVVYNEGTIELPNSGITAGLNGIGYFYHADGKVDAKSLLIGSASTADGRYEIGKTTLPATTNLELNIAGNMIVSYGNLRIRDSRANITITNGELEFRRSVAEYNAVEGTSILFDGSNQENFSGNASNLLGLNNSEFVFKSGSAGTPLTYEIASEDFGSTLDGFTSNFALNTLTVGNADGSGYLQLLDAYSNSTGDDVLYVNNINVLSGSTLDLNNKTVYYQQGTIDGSVVNGSLIQVPEPATLSLLVVGGIVFSRKKFKK